MKMIEGITAVIEVALLAAFVLVLGGFAALLWDLLGGRMRGWLRVMVVVVVAPACALAATGISVGLGWVAASTLAPEEPPPTHTEQRAQEDQERTSADEGRGSETTTERRSASPTATPTASPTASPTSSPTATASPSP